MRKVNTTQQRIGKLVDNNSFSEIITETGTMAVVGTGRIYGRPVFIVAFQSSYFQPDAVFDTISKIVVFLERVLAEKKPLLFIHDTPELPRNSGSTPLSPDYLRLLTDRRGMGRVYCLLARLAEIVPTVSVLLGKVASAQAFPVALSNAAVMTKSAGLCMGRPEVVQQMVGEEVSFSEIGGADIHSIVTGTVDKVVENEKQAIDWARRYLSYLPLRQGDCIPKGDCCLPTGNIAMAKTMVGLGTPFDMHELIDSFIDAASLLELREDYAREVITGLARVNGLTLGIVASNSANSGGILFVRSCRKISRFILMCNTFGIPLLFLADVPGFMIGVEAEQSGIISAGAALFSVLAKITVKKMCIVTRKAFTGGLYAMCGPGFDTDVFLAFPAASIGVYSKETLQRINLDQQTNTPETGENVQQLLEQGLLDKVIVPEQLRDTIGDFLTNVFKKVE